MTTKTDFRSLNKIHYDSINKITYENYLKNEDALKNSKVSMTYSKVIRLTKKILNNEIINNASNVLEIGCGDGTWAIEMAKYGANVTATDISEINIKITKLRAERNNVIINQFPCSCDDIGLENNSFDLIFGNAVIHHLTHDVEESTFKEVYRLLKPGGKAIFVEPLSNSRVLNFLRLLVPITQKHNPRPSILSKSYAKFQSNDPHPEREKTTKHYNLVLNEHGFRNVELQHLVIFSRLDRLTINYNWRKFFHDIDYFIQPVIPFNKLLSRNVIITVTK